MHFTNHWGNIKVLNLNKNSIKKYFKLVTRMCPVSASETGAEWLYTKLKR